MEFEQTVKKPTLKTILGHDPSTGREYGIINEYEAHIHRRAHDYLMVGFVTDVDQVEERREERYKAHVMRIGFDLSQYLTDVADWNKNHADNADPELWQTQPGEYGQIERRVDLPPIEVCRDAIIPQSQIHKSLEWSDLERIAQEGIEKYFNQALNDSHSLLGSQLHDIAAELPTAPFEPIDPGVRTRDELIREYQNIISRMNAIEALMIERNPPADAADNLGLLQPDFSPEVAPTTAKIYIVRHIGRVGADLVHSA
jgi:hypothetical protein